MEWFSDRPVGETTEKVALALSDEIARQYGITSAKERAVLHAIEQGNLELMKKYLNDQEFLNKTTDNFFDAAASLATALHNEELANTLQNYKFMKNYSNIF